MKLLIGNDDGILAQGVQALANALAEAGHDVTVVCPDRERSATGHSLTMHQPIRAEPVGDRFHPSIAAWACSGTPSDCIKLALSALVDSPPDFVLAGINHGANVGTDIIYSGTVSAALEGYIEGIPSVAFSLASFTSRDFQPGVEFALRLMAQLGDRRPPHPLLLNVNIPPVTGDRIAGVTLARQGVRRYTDVFQKRVDPRGKTYYWLAGEVLEELDDEPDKTDIPIDGLAVSQNYITITPLQSKLICQPMLNQMQGWEWLKQV
ncbi:5'/3'-nucleotidase SurE [Phormidium yuhuli AB48]|uniref:5'-nucleotidase SurE n=1 Tax=Phormidium yuhuli AB48 TaxID=2940671 RepID=A0ABY5AMP2_9CYAN|nr:5'/3'-nucleotidase SurE [Phormidium yuhuli]USR90085.1 5'/3'-nucleotidase SurE [Phormidium yuhuli AB48]